ncbi:MFS transporter [Tessaracoccus rhinocerotis]|uniref:MFS transporter n=1 Tax=Tessaracoccus rhinocerotis TaxID=1689449 RepID=A0A553JXA6_9ACTN|nr:MFS transporter [Tessaracoccus rhinocerotis]TRY17076.1 MFS transporter [Tessaracoccus rhinocerotis]
MTAPSPARATPAAWGLFSIGVLAYAVAIMQRTSLGVVGIHAAEHFGTTAGVVSTFVVVQLATYALMMVPVGILLDRWGSRTVLALGTAIMGVSQVVMATTELLPVAIGARILLGVGDAGIFTGALRLLPFWFPPRRVPLLQQMVGLMGQLGQVASVGALLPMVALSGWRPTFMFAAGVSFVMAVVVYLGIRDVPEGMERARSGERLREMPRELAAVARHPATTLGFWIHLTGGFAANTFVMMWGIPFLVVGQGLSQTTASALFILTAVIGAVFGPLIGWLTSRHPLRRSTLALLVIWANLACWVAVLFWPGPAPFWLLILLVVATAAGGPGTAIGLDFTRTNLPAHRLGAANGIVITGSFSASTFAILAIGILVDLMSDGDGYTGQQLRWAMMVQLPIFAVGLVAIHVSRRRLRHLMREQGTIVPSWREVLERYRRR